MPGFVPLLITVHNGKEKNKQQNEEVLVQNKWYLPKSGSGVTVTVAVTVEVTVITDTSTEQKEKGRVRRRGWQL